ncbi:MAG TPA: L-fucokinase, partial [Rectinemataceae bacterium]|nr:L-fucokinase [Rectinemataceae bacterium]
MPIFDACIITAPDERQARVFERLIARRREHGLYPREISFLVYPDPPRGRVGSGGGTLWALYQYAAQLEGLRSSPAEWISGGGPERARRLLKDKRILLLHAGGESRRLPAYYPEAKLFAPVPAASSSVVQPVVLDQELSLFFRYPWRDGELIVASGDVIVDFETELLSLESAPLCGFAAPAQLEQGARHGVFVFDPATGRVRDYLQKADVKTIEDEGRIEGTELCAIDLGIVAFRDRGLDALLDLMATVENGASVLELVSKGTFICDLYLELL